MQLQEQASLTSGNERQRMAITEALTNAMGDELFYQALAWAWDRLAVSCVPNSAFHEVHHSSAVLLSRMIRQPDFMNIRAEQFIREHATFHVDQEGRLYYVREDISSFGPLAMELNRSPTASSRASTSPLTLPTLPSSNRIWRYWQRWPG
jgi:hypothetical protein